MTGEDSLRTLAPMYIVNPIRSAVGSAGLFETHPSTDERVRILRTMAGSGWVDYEIAYQKVRGQQSRCLDSALVASEGSVPCRDAAPADVRSGSALEGEVGGVLDRAALLLEILCECGLKIKVPGRFPKDRIACPRCGGAHSVPQPEPSPTGARADGLTYLRRVSGWDAFRCSCGRVNQLSPGLRVSSIRCKGCRQLIRILPRTA